MIKINSDKSKHKIYFFQMQSLQGGEDAMLRLDQLEALYYELQLQLYDVQAEVLRCEELLLTAQLQSLRRQMTGELRLRPSETSRGNGVLIRRFCRVPGRGGVLRRLREP